MGTTGQIHIVDTGVYLYTHFDANELPSVLRKALIRGRTRWNDAEYMTRIIFCEMIKMDTDGVEGDAGLGIGTGEGEEMDTPLIHVSFTTHTVRIEGLLKQSFMNFTGIETSQRILAGAQERKRALVAQNLITLVNDTHKKIDSAVKGSEKLLYKEIFDDRWKEIMANAVSGVSIAHKVGAFDALADIVLEFTRTTNAYNNRSYSRNSLRIYEAVIEYVLGEGVFTALNEVDVLSAHEPD